MFIGLDLGTSGLKGLVVDSNQKVLAEATAPLTVERPRNGWSEQDPASWIKACDQVMRALRGQVELRAVRAIGLSGQMHGATLLDEADQPLRPCILWNDTRSADQAAKLDADPQFHAVSGNIVFPGFTAPKLVWVAENEPDLFAKTARILLPKDYLRLHLTGEAVSEMSDASGTSWLDVETRDWSEDLLAATGLGLSQMPRLIEGSEPSGILRSSLAVEWGLAMDVVVAGGASDNAASAVGVGVIRPGQALVSLGTSGVLFAATRSYCPDPRSAVHTFCHALPDTWHQMGVILAATDALNWFAKTLGKSAQEITGNLGVLRAPEQSLFLPYLGGERTPYNDAKVRGAFLHLDHSSDAETLTRAVLEGVTHAFRDSFEALVGTGTQIDSLIAVGGGANSEYWLQAIATSLNLPIGIPVKGEFGAAFGAARLAMMATENNADILTPPDLVTTIEPVANLTDAFAEAHGRFRAGYAAIKVLA